MNPKYEQIINIKHHEPLNHKRMPIQKRAAQFSPFDALTGYSAAIKETARETDTKIQLQDGNIEELNFKLERLINNLALKVEISIEFFVKDEKKSGGRYEITTSHIKKYDEYNKEIILANNKKIKIDDIISIDSDFFDDITDN